MPLFFQLIIPMFSRHNKEKQYFLYYNLRFTLLYPSYFKVLVITFMNQVLIFMKHQTNKKYRNFENFCQLGWLGFTKTCLIVMYKISLQRVFKGPKYFRTVVL